MHTDELLSEVENLREKALRAMGLQLERNAKLEINRAVYDTPKSEDYIRTGRLRASLTYATRNAQGSPGKAAESGDTAQHAKPAKDRVYIGTNVEYAAHVEMGTSQMRARPYLRPTLMNHIDEYKKISADILSQLK
jgi:HK97 gp10 family phage protein